MNNNLMNTILTNKWLLKAAVLAVLGGLALPGPVWAAKVKLLATGQTECWNESGGVVGCAGTGQDGEYQKGVTPGKPGRFKDMGDGTVKDLLTGLFWLKDASCNTLGPNGDGTATWQEALDAANGLAAGLCGLTDKSKAGDWRLPNIRELHSLMDFEFVGPALSNAAGDGQWTEGDAFSGVQSMYYWSSTSFVGNPGYAWYVRLGSGLVGDAGKANDFYVWPVRGGK